MFTKKELQQLQSLTLEELQAHKAEAVKAKEELEVLKASKKKAWTDAQQDELNDIVLYIVDIEDMIDEKNAAVPTKQAETSAYTPAKGTEKLVHLKIVKGRRFNPMTGKEISVPYTQMFTFGEWQLFKEYHKGLGYSILEVLYDPYGEAKNYIVK